MNLIIQQIGADGNTKYLEKVATCQPDGNVSMTIDVFDEAMCEQQWDIVCMKEGEEKLEASLRFADYCIGCGEYGKAFDYYSSVLEKIISDDKIITKYQYFAERAYQGTVTCNFNGDECTWEKSSEVLAKYKKLFQKETE